MLDQIPFVADAAPALIKALLIIDRANIVIRTFYDKRVEKRYQVFVSSTFEDLREERASVISALLQLDCFPAGMELFPASDEDSLTLIRSVIDDSDYYLVILGGRYGALDKNTGKSYTHLEYEYALTKGKPTIALLNSNPGALPADKTEGSDEGRRRFNDFREELRAKNCRHWADRSELTTAVFTGIQHLKRTRPAQGWIRATDSVDEKLKDEVLRLRRELDAKEAALQATERFKPPTGVEDLASGRELTEIVIEFPEAPTGDGSVCWGDLIRAVLPHTLGAGADSKAISSAVVSLAKETWCFRVPTTGWVDWERAALSLSSLSKVMVQMVALGLIEATQSGTSSSTTWRATPYGAQEGCRQVAVKTQVRDPRPQD
ncbi:MAG: DUF4062 domain-containing protein [Bryobacteraceae bacterium]